MADEQSEFGDEKKLTGEKIPAPVADVLSSPTSSSTPDIGNASPPQTDKPAVDPAAEKLYQEHMIATRQMSDDASNALVKGWKDNASQDAAKRAEMAPVIQRGIEASSQPMPQMGAPEPKPKVPNAAAGINEWMAASFVMAAFAGAVTRQHSTAALSAMAGMLNGSIDKRLQKDETKEELYMETQKRKLS